MHKLDALTRILEAEDFEAMLIFVRTKTETIELAEKLAARGHACEALNGDIPQKQRERIVERLKDGRLDILVATDVVARGLDVERISHVVNYDIPTDAEAYIHRIGRTGRAGRKGDAILFVAPREQRLLRAIEKTIRQPIEPMQMPTASDINQQRIARFKQRVRDALLADRNELFYQMLTEIQQEGSAEPMEIAAALACLLQGDEPLLLSEKPAAGRNAEKRRAAEASRPAAQDKKRGKPHKAVSDQPLPLKGHPEVVMERFRLAVGYEHGVKPGNIVGAIANEADLDSEYIGHIEIHEHYSTVDLPAGMPGETFHALKKARVGQQRLDIRRIGDSANRSAPGKEGTRPVKRRPKLELKPKAKTRKKAKSASKDKYRETGKRSKKKTARRHAP